MAEFEDRQFYQYPPFNPIIPAPVWGKDAEYAVPVVSSVGNGPAGPKGEDGGYIPFDELTDEQLEKIYMGASACHTYSTDAYVLTTGTQTQRITIPIENISEYDLLCVDVEGLDLVEDTDYTFMDDYIILNQPITHPNTRVHFKAISYQLADGDRTMNVTRIVNEVKPMFANPVEYMGTSEYPAMTIVKYNGAYYVSKKAVPIWTTPDNAEFWQLTFLYEDIMAVAAGGTGADNAADARENLGVNVENVVNGEDIEPASVSAAGEVSAEVDEVTHNLSEKAEDSVVQTLQDDVQDIQDSMQYAAGTRILGTGGSAYGIRSGNLLILCATLTDVSISSTYAWIDIFSVNLADINASNATGIVAYADVGGGGPSYQGQTDAGGFYRIANGKIYAQIQVSKTFSSKHVRYIGVAFVQ